MYVCIYIAISNTFVVDIHLHNIHLCYIYYMYVIFIITIIRIKVIY